MQPKQGGKENWNWAMGEFSRVTQLGRTGDPVSKNQTQEANIGKSSGFQIEKSQSANQIPSTSKVTKALVDQGCQTEISITVDARESNHDS